MRTVQVDLSSDSIHVTKLFGGYQGEHNATLLRIKLPDRMLNANRDPSDQIDQYRFDFDTSTGENVYGDSIEPSAIVGGYIQYYLPQGVMFAPTLSVCVCAFRYNSVDQPEAVLVEKSSAVDLLIKNYVAGSEEPSTVVDPFAPGPGSEAPARAGEAEGSIQNAISTAGTLGFYFKNTSVSGQTFTATLVDKDGNDTTLPQKGDLNGDGAANGYDVWHLFHHLENPAKYPLKQAADFTGWDEALEDFTYDEDTQSYGVPGLSVNVHDAEYLNNAVTDPENFPLVDPAVSCKAGLTWGFCGKITAMSGSVVTITLDSTAPTGWDPTAHEYDASDLDNSGYLWLPFGPQAGTVPIGKGALAVGVNSSANADGAISAGTGSTADGENSVALGEGVVAKGNAQTVVGKNNKPLGSDYLAVVGAGVDDTNRKNAMVVDKDGNMYISGSVYAKNTDPSGIGGGKQVLLGVQINGSDVPTGADGKVNLEMGVWKRLRLGDYTWKRTLDTGAYVFNAPLPTDLYNLLVVGQSRCIICRDYGYHAYQPTNKTFVIGNYLAKGLHIRDDTYSDVASFVAAKGDTYMYYIP